MKFTAFYKNTLQNIQEILFNKLSSKKILTLIKQLSMLISSNIPLLQALEIILQTQDHEPSQKLISSVKQTIQEGYLLSFALRQHNKYFNHLTYQLITVGEQTGKLDTMLERIVIYQEKMMHLKNKIKKALFYPSIVAGTAITVICIFIIFVIPQFADFFSNFNVPLPLPTRILISTTHFLQHYLCIIILLASILTYIGILLRKCNQNIALLIDKQILTLPLFGKIFRKSMVAKLAYSLHAMLSAGIPLVDALQSLHFLSNNHLFNRAIQHTDQLIEQGYPFHDALQTTKIFPKTFTQMVAIGEETGKLDTILQKVSDIYETEVTHLVDELIQLLEPSITVILGIMIGGLTIAMYLPIFKLGMMI
jgi:type IV pilus assembly protein PilC